MANDDQFDMVPVSSSQVASAGYRAETQKMRVEFVNGALYDYSGVPENVYQGLIHAASVGQYFNSAVKNAGYPFERIS